VEGFEEIGEKRGRRWAGEEDAKARGDGQF